MRGLFGGLVDGMESKSAQVLDSLPDFMNWGATVTGRSVGWREALKATAVLACCTVLCNGVSQVPWKVKRARPGGGADDAADHWLYPLLNRKPNGYQTSFDFRQTVMLHMALARNAFVFKSIGSGGRILELIPLEPGRVLATQLDNMDMVYDVTGRNGRTVRLTSREIWHIRGLSWNGWMGLEATRLAASAIGLSLDLEESHARQHANGVQPSGVYSVEGELTEEQYGQLSRWIKKQAGAENKGNPLVLDRGAKWLQQQMTGVDAEHLATRLFEAQEVCRAFNVMPIMIGASEKSATYASAEQMFIAHVVHTLQPLFENLEQGADVWLLGVDNDQGLYTAFDVRGLQRGTLKDQADYFAKGLGSGGSRPWLTQDEVRDELDRNPMGGEAAVLGQPTLAAKPKTEPSDEPSREDA